MLRADTRREREEFLRLLLENTGEFVRFFDPSGQLVYANPAVGRLLGEVPADFAGFAQPEDQERFRRWFERVLAGSPDVLHWRVRAKGGDWRWMETRGTVVPYRGRPHVLTTCRDITAQRQAEEALRESERMLKEAERVAHVGYWDRDLDTGQVSWSDEIYRIFGLEPAGRPLTVAEVEELIHPEDRARRARAVAAALEGGPRFDQEYRVVRPGGEVRVVYSRADVIRDEAGRPRRFFGVTQDVTERKQAEAALRQCAGRLQYLSRRLLEIQEAERRHIARELHDEFGQLLAAIGLHLHAARAAAGEAAGPRLDECLALLRRAGAGVRSLALQLRPTMLETAGLDAALRWLAEQHQQQTGIATRVEGHTDGVAGDLAVACFRVAQEALTNVVRHARARHVWIEVSQGEDVLELAVRDDGVGFDVEGTLGQAAARGRLGLVGMRERAELFGGRLDVDSAPGRGTRIRARFPLTGAPPAPGGSGE